MAEVWTPQKAANRLVRLAEHASTFHGTNRFPIDVTMIAKDAANIFGWNDPITQIKAASIAGFEGALFPDDSRKRWILLYNNSISSHGRIRFTQAHELGHYILHRLKRESFQCSDTDMLNWSKDDRDIEGQADLFASFLLMPLDDYRKQATGTIDLELLSHCADRYGVSLTAAILKWLQYTDEKAIVVMSNDGFMRWAWSSDAAYEVGAVFATRKNLIPIPESSIAANTSIMHDRKGTQIPAKIWFGNAESATLVREMKIYAEQYDSILTLLVLPRSADVRRSWMENR